MASKCHQTFQYALKASTQRFSVRGCSIHYLAEMVQQVAAMEKAAVARQAVAATEQAAMVQQHTKEAMVGVIKSDVKSNNKFD